MILYVDWDQVWREENIPYQFMFYLVVVQGWKLGMRDQGLHFKMSGPWFISFTMEPGPLSINKGLITEWIKYIIIAVNLIFLIQYQGASFINKVSLSSLNLHETGANLEFFGAKRLTSPTYFHPCSSLCQKLSFGFIYG